jgi:heavy metal translocating P-type ATPase
VIRARVAELRPVAALGFLTAGLLALAAPDWPRPHAWWTAGLWILGLPLVLRTLWGMLHGRFAADLVASLAVLAAILLDDPLPGLVVVLMQTGGEALERRAAARATRAVAALEAEAPRTAHRVADGAVEDVPAEAIAAGERLLVRPGELVPCDAVVVEGRSHMDRAQLHGEPIPERVGPGAQLRSGARNLEGALTVRALRPASESTYAEIVRLVRSAQASKAPLQRVADRYAAWFTPLTLAACAVAWALSGDAGRVLAVLVVATPCPLILAAPVAIIGGIDRGARRQIIFRHGGALEAIASVDTAVFDKTGTLTVGRPEVAEVRPAPGWTADEALRLAAAVEEGSGHPLARSVTLAARARGLDAPLPEGIEEAAGQGVRGRVEGRAVAVGSPGFVRAAMPSAAGGLARLHDGTPGLAADLGVDGEAAALITFADHPRPELRAVLDRMGRLGIGEIHLLSGDHTANATALAAEAGITRVQGDMLPRDKAARVRELTSAGRRVLMVGDGTNDAPALSAAAVGVALGGHGSGGIAAEAADVVLLVDDLARIPEAMAIGRDTMRIARQSIVAGLGLSAAGMVVAALGYLPPTAGALAQEAIDLAVILNALRAAR